MGLIVVQKEGMRFLEGAPGLKVMYGVGDVISVLEACFSGHVDRVLLYAENLTERFFDLSSGEAGAILQKLRDYRIQLAVVYSPGKVRLSRRFSEMMAEENRAPFFRLFDGREAAEEWLRRDGS